MRARSEARNAAGAWPYRSCAERPSAAHFSQARPSRRFLAASATRVVPVPGNACQKHPGRLAGHRFNVAPRRWPARSDQVIQRPGQVMPGDQCNLVIDAKMADRPSRNRAVGRQGGQGTRQELLPWAAVAGRGGVNHPAPHGAVRADQGHHDPHQFSLSPPAAFRQAHHDDGGLRARPAGTRLAAKSGTVHPSAQSRALHANDLAIAEGKACTGRGRPAQDDTASRAARHRRTAKRK